MTEEEAIYRIENPYARCGIHSTALVFARRALMEARQALEHGQGFATPHARETLEMTLAEAERCRELLAVGPVEKYMNASKGA